ILDKCGGTTDTPFLWDCLKDVVCLCAEKRHHFEIGIIRHNGTISVFNATPASPATCLPPSGSSRKIHARMAICGSMVLLMMLDSTAVSVCRDLFHSVKASAVLTSASQPMMPHCWMVNMPTPCVKSPMTSMSTPPTPILMVVTVSGLILPCELILLPRTDAAEFAVTPTNAAAKPMICPPSTESGRK